MLGNFKCLLLKDDSVIIKLGLYEGQVKKLVSFYRNDLQYCTVVVTDESHMWLEIMKEIKISSKKAMFVYCLQTRNLSNKCFVQDPSNCTSADKHMWPVIYNTSGAEDLLKDTTGRQRFNRWWC